MEKEFQLLLQDARDERQVADYETYEKDYFPNEELARSITGGARSFIERMRIFIE